MAFRMDINTLRLEIILLSDGSIKTFVCEDVWTEDGTLYFHIDHGNGIEQTGSVDLDIVDCYRVTTRKRLANDEC